MIQTVDDVSISHAADRGGTDPWNGGCRNQIFRVTSAAEGRLQYQSSKSLAAPSHVGARPAVFCFVFVFGVFLGHFRFAVRFNPVFEISLAYIFSTFPATKSPQLIGIRVYALPSCIGLQAIVTPRYTRGWRHPWQSIILDSRIS